MAGNGDVYESRLFRADSQLENLYIETTNFSDNTFAISTIRRMGMKLKDVFVDLGNTSAVPDFDGRNNVAALFNVDYTWNNIMVNDRVDLAEMENVRVVSGKVMPIGNGYAWEGSGPFSAVKDYDGWEDYGGYSWYVNFAKTTLICSALSIIRERKAQFLIRVLRQPTRRIIKIGLNGFALTM